MMRRSASRSSPADALATRPSLPAIPPALHAGLRKLAEALAFSSGLAALVGGALTFSVGLSLGCPSPLRAAVLVGSSAFFIYNVDRLRDVDRDRATSPIRTDFVAAHRRPLLLGSAVAALGVAGQLAVETAPVVALCALVGAVGLLHRRMKQAVLWKVCYVAAAWTAAAVGIPWIARGADAATAPALWAMALVGTSLWANLIASNLRDGKPSLGCVRRGRALAAARVAATGAAALFLVAPAAIAPLAWIPAAEALALWCFRPSEHYGHFAIDGALSVGALVAILACGASTSMPWVAVR